jgi:MFS family permease
VREIQKLQTIQWTHIAEQKSLVLFAAALLSLGQICGSLLTALMTGFLGRKATTLLSCLPCLIGWICLGFASNQAALMSGRFLIGLGIGLEGKVLSIEK